MLALIITSTLRLSLPHQGVNGTYLRVCQISMRLNLGSLPSKIGCDNAVINLMILFECGINTIKQGPNVLA